MAHNFSGRGGSPGWVGGTWEAVKGFSRQVAVIIVFLYFVILSSQDWRLSSFCLVVSFVGVCCFWFRVEGFGHVCCLHFFFFGLGLRVYGQG